MFDLSQGRKKICLEKSFDLGHGRNFFLGKVLTLDKEEKKCLEKKVFNLVEEEKNCLEESFDLGRGNTQDDGVVRRRSPSMSINQGFQMHFIMR